MHSGRLGGVFDSELSSSFYVGGQTLFLMVAWGAKYDFYPHVNLLFYSLSYIYIYISIYIYMYIETIRTIAKYTVKEE
jgi:hypothetical protein